MRILIENAAELREAGVTHISVGGCEAEIGPHSDPLPEPEEQDDFIGDPVDDPATHGGLLPKRPPRN